MPKEEEEKAKTIIKKYDPDIVAAALSEMGLDDKNKKIAREGLQSTLDKMSGDEQVKRQILAEAQTDIDMEIVKKEIEKVKTELKAIDKPTLVKVVGELIEGGVVTDFRCDYHILPCHHSFQIFCRPCLHNICALPLGGCGFFKVICPPLIRPPPICPPMIKPPVCPPRIVICPPKIDPCPADIYLRCTGDLHAFDIVDKGDLVEAFEKLAAKDPKIANRIKKMLEEAKRAGEL